MSAKKTPIDEPKGEQSTQKFSLPVPVSWIGIAIVAIFIVGFLILSVPPLLSPPPQDSPPAYQAFATNDASAKLDPSEEQLLTTPDGMVSLLLPVGAIQGQGTIIMQTRESGLIPRRIENKVERIRAVDLLMMDQDGEIIETAEFQEAALLCFKLDKELQSIRKKTPNAVDIQYYDERTEPPKWDDLKFSLQSNTVQVCTELEHLSIFALSVNRSLLSPTATPRGTVEADATQESTPTPTKSDDLYSFPDND